MVYCHLRVAFFQLSTDCKKVSFLQTQTVQTIVEFILLIVLATAKCVLPKYKNCPPKQLNRHNANKHYQKLTKRWDKDKQRSGTGSSKTISLIVLMLLSESVFCELNLLY